MREVKKFQAASGLTVDGICGPMTWAALDAAVRAVPDTSTVLLYTVHIPHQTGMQRTQSFRITREAGKKLNKFLLNKI